MNAFLLAYIYVRIFRLILRNVRLLFRKIMSVVTILLASRVQNTKHRRGLPELNLSSSIFQVLRSSEVGWFRLQAASNTSQGAAITTSST